MISRFVNGAQVAQATGFGGIQLHSAHGYLLSEFLSPVVNQRKDQWGGALENRARLLLTFVARIREACGSHFGISVKLNSADFQKGGFSEAESMQVAKWLEDAGVDLLEVSGGTYEQLSFFGTEQKKAESTLAREAYFLEYAEQVRRHTKIPLMVTGGFRSLIGMNRSLAEGELDVVGLGRPMCVDTALPRDLLEGRISGATRYEDRLRIGPGFLSPASKINRIKNFNHMYAQGWYCVQLLRLGAGLPANPQMSIFSGMIRYLTSEMHALRALER